MTESLKRVGVILITGISLELFFWVNGRPEYILPVTAVYLLFYGTNESQDRPWATLRKYVLAVALVIVWVHFWG